MVTPATKVNDPTDTVKLVGRVAVHVLSLLHVDAGDLVALCLTFPGTGTKEISITRLLIQLLPLVEADTIRVCFDEAALITHS